MAITPTHYRRKAPPRGFTVFFAMLVGGLALAVGLSIYDLTVRELDLSGTATQSQYAIYAADTGAECALYWDFKCTLGSCSLGSAFATSSTSVYPGDSSLLNCNNVDITGATRTVSASANAATTTFRVTFAPQQYCVDVTVAKRGNPTDTVITSRGYNICTVGSQVRLERVLQVTY